MAMEAEDTVTPSGGEMRDTLVRGVGRATAGAHERIDQAQEAARPAVDRMAANAHEVVDRVAGAATQAAETLGVKGDQIKTAQDKLVESAREYMHEHPVATLGAAVAVGFVLSRLLSSR
jgi:ElaB protein